MVISEENGITTENLSILKNGKAIAVRCSTLKAICKAMDTKLNYFKRGILAYAQDLDETAE
ncbi:helix-turn-helix domain-containing protein [Neobacillus soli]|uniref:helix-turn-helix domain-containing protein n=1 Tax=Neobacillus soli TaxID=220688 RepID=UPI000825F2FA|nr:helix-turn-helix domain-containing protein [Neobacillus soli]